MAGVKKPAQGGLLGAVHDDMLTSSWVGVITFAYPVRIVAGLDYLIQRFALIEQSSDRKRGYHKCAQDHEARWVKVQRYTQADQ